MHQLPIGLKVPVYASVCTTYTTVRWKNANTRWYMSWGHCHFDFSFFLPFEIASSWKIVESVPLILPVRPPHHVQNRWFWNSKQSASAWKHWAKYPWPCYSQVLPFWTYNFDLVVNLSFMVSENPKQNEFLLDFPWCHIKEYWELACDTYMSHRAQFLKTEYWNELAKTWLEVTSSISNLWGIFVLSNRRPNNHGKYYEMPLIFSQVLMLWKSHNGDQLLQSIS